MQAVDCQRASHIKPGIPTSSVRDSSNFPLSFLSSRFSKKNRLQLFPLVPSPGKVIFVVINIIDEIIIFCILSLTSRYFLTFE